MTIEDEIKNALAKNAVVVGARTVIKALKTRGAKAVVVATNAPDTMRKDLQHYASISKVPLHSFNGTGKQLGIFLGKPFPVAALALRESSTAKGYK